MTAQSEGRRTSTTATGLHVQETGQPDGPVLLLIGSLATSLQMWDPQVTDLGRRFRVVRYDHRGHGGSASPPLPWSIDDLGADLLRVLDHLAVRSASVCGLSLGGMVAMWAAAHAPERVERLVLCATGTHFAPGHWAERMAQARRGGLSAVAAPTAARWFTPGFAERQPQQVARISAMIAATTLDGYLGCCGAMEGMDLRPVLADITAPTLVVSGAQDLGASPTRSQALAEQIAAGRAPVTTAVVDEAAHLVNLEQPERFTRLLQEHLLGLGS